MSEPSPAVIKKTQDTLGKYVKRPPLTDKLLKKPPFRFLHDVINAIIKDTGFLKGLYKPEELVSDNVKDRDAKISFLQKLIDVTSIATKKTISAKPSKIVAGQEPEKTNELLQIIGMAIQNKVDSKKAIDEWRNRQEKTTIISQTKVKKGGVVAGKTTTVTDTNKEKIPEVNEKISEDLEKKPRVDSGIVEDGSPAQDDVIEVVAKESLPLSLSVEIIKPPEIPLEVHTEKVLDMIKVDPVKVDPVKINPVKLDPEPVSPPASLPKAFANGVDEKQDELIQVIDEEANRRRKKTPTSRKSSSENVLKDQEIQEPPPQPKPTTAAVIVTAKKDVKPSGTVKKEATPTPKPPPLNPPGEQINRPIRPRTSLRPPSVRPASARPGAPRKRDRNVEVVIQADENVQLGDINVKVEQFKAGAEKLDDDDDNLIVIESVNIQDTLLQQSELLAESQYAVDVASDSHQGQLVKQILETQKEFEGGDSITNKSVQNQSSSVVSELRDQIQKLTKSVQPLGKFMDFLLEDIDSMQREHEMWRERGKEVALKLAREKNATEGSVQSLRHQLDELNFELQEKYSALFSVRENILVNEERILILFKNL